jgi:hypothetical protein
MFGTTILCVIAAVAWMINPLIVLGVVVTISLWLYHKRHPDRFPPGPRFPLPFIGDGYILGRDMAQGNANNAEK